MKKKLISLILALVCVIACVFGLAGCNSWYKVKDAAHWKQAITDARKSDQIKFSVTLWQATSEDSYNKVAEMNIEASGNDQHIEMKMRNPETDKFDSVEYYYDGEYVYLNVKDQKLDYYWQKIKADTDFGKQFAEPLSYIDMVYSGEMAREMGADVTFDNLDKLSERYADAVLGYEDESGGGECVYGIADVDITYFIMFVLEDHTELNLTIRSDNVYLWHEMGNEVTVTIPTTSVQEADNTNN